MAETLCIKAGGKADGGVVSPLYIVKDNALVPSASFYTTGCTAAANPFKLTPRGNVVAAAQLFATVDVTEYKTITWKGNVLSWLSSTTPSLGFTTGIVSTSNNETVNIGTRLVLLTANGNFERTVDISSYTGHKMLSFGVSGTKAWSGYMTISEIYLSK